MRIAVLVLVLFSALARPVRAQLNIAVSPPDSSIQISHSSLPTLEYYVERSFDLTTWSRFGDLVAGTGNLLVWSDPSRNGRLAFYRLTSVPLIAHALYGIGFSPYTDGQSPYLNTPISRAQIEQRMRVLIPYTGWIRTFSMVDGLEVSGQVAHQLGFKAALGAWLGPETDAASVQSNQTNINNLIAAGQAGEADLLIVGSEVLQRGDLSASNLTAYLNQVRAAVPTVPVTTADTYNTLVDPANLAVVNACDLLFVNIYPFHESQSIEGALTDFFNRYLSVVVVANGKPVWISETGWPSDGPNTGAAVPSTANAADYFCRFVSWARATNVPFFYFEAFDEAWKIADQPEGPYWGVWDKTGALKTGRQSVFDNLYSPADWDAPVNGVGNATIAFGPVPPLGSTDPVTGTVSHIGPFDGYVALFIQVGGQWYEKPYANAPLTAFATDGSWSVDYTTGGASDTMASQIVAYLFPVTYLPPPVLGIPNLPSEFETKALAKTPIFSRP